jgi:hypothetical protein
MLATEAGFATRVKEAFARVEREAGGDLEDTDRGDGASPFVFGRLLWAWTHLLADHYPDVASIDTQQAATMYFLALPALLPCQSECAPALADALARSPPQVAGRRQLRDWVWQLHNHVNRKTGAPEFSYAQMEAAASEQRGAAAAVVFYAKKEDLQRVQAPVSVLAALRYEWANVDTATMTAVCSVGAAVLLLLLCAVHTFTRMPR